ncbi:GtrA family protein [Natrialbaceae archaeon GCM10025810]|uniref:GtrA family protein n=1 Tax=Halovalidus salilacus TaxID=3075124 RepID=UPI00361746DA
MTSDSLSEAVRRRAAALRSRSRFRQFAGVGLVGASVDNALLYLLVEHTLLGPLGAKVVAWEVAIAAVFVVNERWTFADYGGATVRSLWRRFARSNLVRFGGFCVTMAVLWALVYGASVWYLLANAIGMLVGFFVNYACESLYTWRVHRHP